MTSKRNIPIALPSVGEEEWLATRECFESGWLTQGPKVRLFEESFAQRHQVKHAIATTSCTTGLHLVLAALDIGPGDEVIIPAFTWVATANVVVYCGATPVFVDIDPQTYNMDHTKVIAAVTPRTRAVILVHLFGLCADMDAIRSVLPDHVTIVEDAACAAGASYKGTPAGGLGDAAVFSFHPRKSITTGEGGMVTTNDDQLSERINKMRNHGATISEEQRHNGPKPYLLPEFDLLGYNYRMTDLQGAVGLVQLEKLDCFIVEREELAAVYDEALADLDWLQKPQRAENRGHAWQAYVCRLTDRASPARNDLMEQLQACGIATRPGTHAVTTLGYYQKVWGTSDRLCPNAVMCENSTIALPLHNKMTVDDCRYVSKAIYSLAGITA